MNYFDAVVLNDNETYTGINGSHLILNAVEDSESGQLITTKKSVVIPLQDLVDLYLKDHSI